MAAVRLRRHHSFNPFLAAADDDGLYRSRTPSLFRTREFLQFCEQISSRREILRRNRKRRHVETVSRGFSLSDFHRGFLELGLTPSEARKSSNKFCLLLDRGLEPCEAFQKVIYGTSFWLRSMADRIIDADIFGALDGVPTLGLGATNGFSSRCVAGASSSHVPCCGRAELASTSYTVDASYGISPSHHVGNRAARSSASCGNAQAASTVDAIYGRPVANWAAGASSSRTPYCCCSGTSTTCTTGDTDTSSSTFSFTGGSSISPTPGDPFATTGTFDRTNAASDCICCSNGDPFATSPTRIQPMAPQATEAPQLSAQAGLLASSQTRLQTPPQDVLAETPLSYPQDAEAASQELQPSRQTVAEPQPPQQLQKFPWRDVAFAIAGCILGYRLLGPPPNQTFHLNNSTLNNGFANISAFERAKGKIQYFISLFAKGLFGGKGRINAM